MPVEIKELQIVTIVTDKAGSPAGAQTSQASANPDKLIAACVEQVLEILKQKNDR